MRKDCQFHWFEHELWETLCSYINKIISLQAPLLYCVFDHFVLLHKIPNICRSYSYFSMLFRCSLVLVQLLLVSFVLLKAHANGRNKSQHCCVLLGVFGQQCYVRLQEPKSLTGFKLYATTANKCQHCSGSMQTYATSHNIAACCWGFLDNNVATVCMGLKSVTGFKLYATSANKCQHCCGSMQTDATCLGPTMLRVVGQKCCIRLHGP